MTGLKIGIALGALLALILVFVNRYVGGLEGRVLNGVVLIDDPDPKKQVPIANAQVSAPELVPNKVVIADSTGVFQLQLPPSVRVGQLVALYIQHPDYSPSDVMEPTGPRPHIFHLKPLPHLEQQDAQAVKVSSVRVRYTVHSEATMNVGSAAKTFEIENTPDIRCSGKEPCSPDGRWKASIGGASLDAGDGNEFRNARVACIAGPCLYSKIEKDDFTRGGRIIKVSVKNWANTTTYLMAAEVAHRMVRNEIQQSYPVIYGNALSFILPPEAQGPSIQAEVDGMDILYPLGPTLNITWATCAVQPAVNGSRFYQCELKPGYRFP